MINVIKGRESLSKTLDINEVDKDLLHKAACIGLAELLDQCSIDPEVKTVTLDFDGAVIITKALQVIDRPISMNEALLLGYIINDIVSDTASQLVYLRSKHNLDLKPVSKPTFNLN